MTQEQVRQIVREELAAQEIKRNNAAASSWALEYIQRAIQAGILTGVDDGQGGLTIAAPPGECYPPGDGHHGGGDFGGGKAGHS